MCLCLCGFECMYVWVRERARVSCSTSRADSGGGVSWGLTGPAGGVLALRVACVLALGAGGSVGAPVPRVKISSSSLGRQERECACVCAR